MKKILLTILFVLLPLNVLAASKPGDIVFPDVKSVKQDSDCKETLKDWNFSEEVIPTKNKEYLFLVIDRYGGKRDYPDYRGTMCRVSNMTEMWPVYELFHDLDNVILTEDGKYLINSMGNVACETPEDIERIAPMDVLLFHKNGDQIKGYKMDEMMPNWKEQCAEKKEIDWLDSDIRDGLSEDGSTFTLKTDDGITHTFNVSTGEKISSPNSSN